MTIAKPSRACPESRTAYLVHNREILLRCDDSVVKPMAGRVRQFRRSRGYVPAPLELHKEVPSDSRGRRRIEKYDLPDARPERVPQPAHRRPGKCGELRISFAKRWNICRESSQIHPDTIAYDLHPDYFSTKWALAQTGVRLVGVQHHHAHIASCMAENAIEGKVIGFALDGTGYGTDGAVWGGEALLASYASFERAGHFEYVPLPGGAAAIREPWRMGVSYLAHTFGKDFLDLGIPFTNKIARGKAETMLRMMERRVNSPLTSSCGRLFDGVAAVIGLREVVDYEAQAAMEIGISRPGSAEGCGRLSVFTDPRGQLLANRGPPAV